MKIITAMVQPFMLSKVTHALEELEDFPGMTVTDARGFGAARRRKLHEDQASHFKDFNEKVRIEIVAHDRDVERIVETIVSAAHTGNHGDGKVFVWPVEQAVRIQTGETDDQAV
jgi:nitrogen regulatory protein P-II 1